MTVRCYTLCRIPDGRINGVDVAGYCLRWWEERRPRRSKVVDIPVAEADAMTEDEILELVRQAMDEDAIA